MTDDDVVALAARVARVERARDTWLAELARVDLRVTRVERAWVELDRRVTLVERALGDIGVAVDASRAQLGDVRRIAAMLDDLRAQLDPAVGDPERPRRWRQSKPF